MNFEKILLIFFAFIIIFQNADAQSDRTLFGQVSYLSSKNVYVKFENTEAILPGDTLFAQNQNQYKAILIVRQKSSSSCVCEKLTLTDIKIGDKIIYIDKMHPKNLILEDSTELAILNKPSIAQDRIVYDTVLKKTLRKEVLSGRISFSTNSNINPDISNNYQRIRTNLSFNFQNINHSPFSFQTYMTYRHRYGIDQQQSGFFDDYKLFSFVVDYQPNEKYKFSFGRKININIANLGSVDGLQIEYYKKQYTFGVLAGTRPDIYDYSVDINLPQFGAFIMRSDKLKSGIAATTLAFAQQMYGFKTDRRFLYFQHNNSFFKDLNFFVSSEFDLFQKVNNISSNKLNFTSLYFSVRYKILKNLSLSGSYDNRRNIIYYESYQTLVDQLLAQSTRQGWRAQLFYSPFKKLNFNISGFIRYQSDNTKPTTNYVATFNFTKLPILKSYFSLSYNVLNSYYYTGTISGAKVSNNFLKNKLSTEFNFRYVNYKYNNSEFAIVQNIYGVNLSYNVFSKTSVMLSYEGTYELTKTYHLYYITLIQRFKKNK